MSERPTTKHDIQRDEENITRPGFDVITNILVSGTLSMLSTGVDLGTGQVILYGSPTALPQSQIGIYGLSGTTGLGTGTSLSVRNFLVLSITGTFLYLSASVGLDVTQLATGNRGVSNGDSHDHDGGDGGMIGYFALSGKPSVSGHTLNTDVTPLGYQTVPFHGLNGTPASGTTNFLPPFFYGVNATNFSSPIPRAGNLKNLSVKTNSAQPASGTLVFTIQVDGVDTTITTTVSAGAAAGTFTDSTHTVAITAGQRVGVKVVNNASSASAQIAAGSLEFEYNTA
jgi:hypothetical protein